MASDNSEGSSRSFIFTFWNFKEILLNFNLEEVKKEKNYSIEWIVPFWKKTACHSKCVFLLCKITIIHCCMQQQTFPTISTLNTFGWYTEVWWTTERYFGLLEHLIVFYISKDIQSVALQFQKRLNLAFYSKDSQLFTFLLRDEAAQNCVNSNYFSLKVKTHCKREVIWIIRQRKRGITVNRHI